MWRTSSSLRSAMRSAISRIDRVARSSTVAMAEALRARPSRAPVRGPYEPDSRFPAWTCAGASGTVSAVRGVIACLLAFCAAAAPARAAVCPNMTAVQVPGAEMQKSACLDDLTTAGTAATGHTDPSDYAGLFPVEQKNPSGVHSLQVDGYFPDTSTYNNENGWFHDAQFVMRFPNEWNGKLVITGAPGIRKQYSVDPVIGDFVLARGYAYASTDKGNDGTLFYQDDGGVPGQAIAEWNRRVTQLTI